jgi:hypothetical protein
VSKVSKDQPEFKVLQVIRGLKDNKVILEPMEQQDPKVQQALRVLWDRRVQKAQQVLKAYRET